LGSVALETAAISVVSGEGDSPRDEHAERVRRDAPSRRRITVVLDTIGMD
jgi:hypothetical protein